MGWDGLGINKGVYVQKRWVKNDGYGIYTDQIFFLFYLSWGK